MERPAPKGIALILARELATNVATPMFLVDARGRLVFFNEAAGVLLGTSFGNVGELGPEEWSTMFHPEDLSGTAVTLDGLPLGHVLDRNSPSHVKLRIRALDGAVRTVAITAFPLYTRTDELGGAVAVFWEDTSGG